jgi:hypothetical protein
LKDGKPLKDIFHGWQLSRKEFVQERARVLLY